MKIIPDYNESGPPVGDWVHKQYNIQQLDPCTIYSNFGPQNLTKTNMPSTSKKQQRFMGAELARKRAGKKTQTGMSEKQLGDFARTTKSSGKKKAY